MSGTLFRRRDDNGSDSPNSVGDASGLAHDRRPISDVERIDLTADADSSQITDLLSAYDEVNAETAAIKEEAANSQMLLGGEWEEKDAEAEAALVVEEEASTLEPDDSSPCPVCCKYFSANQCLDRHAAASSAPSVGASSGGGSGTSGSKSETAIMLDESDDDEVQIVSEVRPGKRRALEKPRDNRQPVLVLCGEGSKKLRITLRLEPDVPLIFIYSKPAVAEALVAQLQLKEQLGGAAGGGGTAIAADDAVSLAKHFEIIVKRRRFDHMEANSATIMSAGVEPDVPVYIVWVGDKLTDESRWMGEGPRKGEVEEVQIVRLAYTHPTSRQLGAYAQAVR